MSNVKECKKCGKMEVHSKDASRPDGLQLKCKKCQKAYRAKPENKEKAKARDAARNAKLEIKERRKAYNAAYYAEPENKEKRKVYDAEPENKKKVNARTKERRENDLVFRTRMCLRDSLRHFLNGESKSEKTRELLGCSYEEYVEYQNAIESDEVRAARARGERIENDHNIPVHAGGIDPRIESHRKAMCHYTNFFLLERTTNGSKSNHTPEGFNLDAWLEEQTARIAACEGKTPMETIEQNREYIAAAHAFADRFRIQ